MHSFVTFFTYIALQTTFPVRTTSFDDAVPPCTYAAFAHCRTETSCACKHNNKVCNLSEKNSITNISVQNNSVLQEKDVCILYIHS